MSGKKIIDAKNDSDGNVKSVLLQGNKTFTPIETAIRMADKGKIDAVAVHPLKAKDHIRTKPDDIKNNNLDELAKD
jgi:hypothetical protein